MGGGGARGAMMDVEGAATASGPGANPGDPVDPGSDQKTDTANWLIHVQYVGRQEPTSEQLAEIEALREQVEKNPGERDRLFAALAAAEQRVEEERGFVIYGWCCDADAKGLPTSTNKSLAAFFVPFEQSSSAALAALRTGDFALAPRAGSRPTLTIGGRCYWEVTGARPAEAVGQWEHARAPEMPPARSGSGTTRARARRAVDATISFVRTSAGASGQLYRYTTRVSVPNPPRSAQAARVWMLLRFTTEDGRTLGPFIDSIDLSRGDSGSMGVTRGFDLHAAAGVALKPTSATVEVIDVDWRSARDAGRR